MNNQELELKLRELCSISNFVEALEKAVSFEKEYKQTSFYKNTKISLLDLIQKAKIWYTFDWDSLMFKIQNSINTLDLTRINEIIDEFGQLFANENNEILEIAGNFAELIKQ